MKFRTPINTYEPLDLIDYQTNVLLIGSCFAEHLFSYLNDRKYKALLNPCGISFNPVSISNSLYYRLGMLEFGEQEVQQSNGRHFHYDFHSQFSGTSLEEIKSNITDQLYLHKKAPNPDVIVLSLGTSYVYELIERGEIVNNCHKVPQSKFKKSILSFEQILETLSLMIENACNVNSRVKFILTVSPVRHVKDGLLENNRSKSRLLLACEALENKFPDVHYFPSYEILMDDLRDYRFYKSDMIHPNKDAVDYIMQHFENKFMESSEIDIRNEVMKVQRSLEHRPFNRKSLEHQKFLTDLKEKITLLEANYNLNFKQELTAINQQIESDR